MELILSLGIQESFNYGNIKLYILKNMKQDSELYYLIEIKLCILVNFPAIVDKEDDSRN